MGVTTTAPAPAPVPSAATAPKSAALPAPAGADEELASRLRVAVTRLHRKLRLESLAGLSPTQSATLASINRLGRPTLGELAQVEQVQPPTMTRMVATMEAAGLVVRHGDAADRRVSRVELSAKGRSTLERIRRLKTAFLVRRLGQLSATERASAAELAQLLERLVEEG